MKRRILTKIMAVVLAASMILGNFTMVDASEDTSVKITTEKFSFGSQYSGAIDEDGSLYIWGNNYNGRKW